VPRQAAEALTVVRPDTTVAQPRLTPPASLTNSERLEFTAIVAENQHLRRTDAQMLALYVITVAKAAKLARLKDIGAAERATRVAISLARAMRLTQQAQRDPVTVGRGNRKAERAAKAAAILAEWDAEYGREDDDADT
jgi:hypothetical protein